MNNLNTPSDVFQHIANSYKNNTYLSKYICVCIDCLLMHGQISTSLKKECETILFIHKPKKRNCKFYNNQSYSWWQWDCNIREWLIVKQDKIDFLEELIVKLKNIQAQQ